MVLNALSFQLEEWFHAPFLSRYVTEAHPARRLPWAIEPILILLDCYNVKATFFVSGDTLRHEGALITRIYAAGHEIGCHGWRHRPLWSLDRERFAAHLRAFDRMASTLLPIDEVVGFRAPLFSLDERSAWAVQVLADHGYRYDSSIYGFHSPWYGVEACPDQPYRLHPRDLTRDAPDGLLWEFPLTVSSLGEAKLPLCGGFYLRLWPLLGLVRLLRRVNASGRPFVVYLSPWETDLAMKLPSRIRIRDRLLTSLGARTALRKLEVLLQSFDFAPLREILGTPSRSS